MGVTSYTGEEASTGTGDATDVGAGGVDGVVVDGSCRGGDIVVDEGGEDRVAGVVDDCCASPGGRDVEHVVEAERVADDVTGARRCGSTAPAWD